MKIYVSKYNGFCNGVKSAVRLALLHKGERVFTLGNLIHNKRVVEQLKQQGITPVQDISNLKQGDTLIIRAHGAPKAVFTECNQKGIKIVDATCAFVRRIQKMAEKFYRQGYKIVLFGDKTHPEIIGINGWCDNQAIITDGTEKVDIRSFEKVAVLFQTTYNHNNVQKSLDNLISDGVKTLVVFNTICYTTIGRQNFAQSIPKRCDYTIVVGDKLSSNSNKLLHIASGENNKAVLIEDASEISDLSNYEKICVIAGASTPSELMEEVLSKMFAEAKDNAQVVEVNEEFAQAVDNIPVKRNFRKGQKVKCKVVLKHAEGVSVTIPNSKGDGFIPNEELSIDGNYQEAKDALKVGETVEGIVVSTDKVVTLSKKEVDLIKKQDKKVEAIKNGETFELVIQKAVKGGLLSKLGSYTVFVPASQIRIGFVKNLEQYVGKKLRLVAMENGVDDNKRKIVASQREILLKEKREREDNFWNNIEVNEIVEGKVLRFSSFGAFVNVRGFDCLAHLTDLSWKPIKSPDEVLEIGKVYDFVVLKLDRENNRVSIGYKQLQPHPWAVAAEKFPVGSIVKGKVARILSFGAFVELDDGIDGLLHISNVSWEWLGDINEALKVGDIIDVKVIEFDAENKRVTLSRKDTMEKPAQLPKRNKADKKQEEQAE